ncbi:HTH-type transcriptional activator CmpR [Pseudovibrio axinellae]|uniref:HTH-type transcriptional activator CmpR n=1 Tax=Pseudovibrio axinellae TaxID=989403 RepID=A0A161X9L5_9HYPH|nr:LysR substrate-binding domain-containing protein [Pseudovibrio axinellae]KZL09110.1 HTH-type transcriptional activator CmpR [Pseudovibrio axinellae]SER75642.1 DNA-binding transcriptional regulator, LysR family [Pseudovibrio axinellae]
MKITTTQLDAFSAVMEVGTTSGAADALNTSQPSISRALQQFEAATGLVLFERNGNRLRPTSEAYELNTVVSECYIRIERIQTAAEDLRAQKEGILRIGYTPDIALGFLAKIVRRMQLVNNRDRLILKPLKGQDMLTATQTREIDFGLTSRGLSDASVLCECIASVNQVLVLSQDHTLAGKTVISVADLQDQELVLQDASDPCRKRFEMVLAAKGTQIKSYIEVCSSEAACRMAVANLGIALTNPLTAMDFVDFGLCMRRFESSARINLSLVSSENTPHKATSHHFVTSLKNHLAFELGEIERCCPTYSGISVGA